MAKGNAIIGARIAELRKSRSLTQGDLARLIGIQHGTTIHEIEKGRRALKAVELTAVARALRISALDLLREEGPPPSAVVRWREVTDETAKKQEEALFVDRCRRYSFVERITGASSPRSLRRFDLDISHTSYETAATWADSIRGELGLGDIPAPALRDALESTAGIKVFLFPLRGGSGAATVIEGGPAILANSREPLERRAFSLAHELFHLLTWDALPHDATPLPPSDEKRNEQLANAFAARLLLPPASVLERLGPDPVEGRRQMDLVTVARQFGVSLPLFAYNLVNLGRLSKDAADHMLTDESRYRVPLPDSTEQPTELPERYVILAFKAYVDGEISVGKLAELLETTVGELPKVLADHGFSLDVDDYQAEILSA